MTRVVLDGLVRRLDRVAIVDGASIEVQPGELTAVVGPPRAGKTALARLIAGLDSADEGEIYFDGRVMNATSPLQRRVGLVFQEGRALAPPDGRAAGELSAQAPRKSLGVSVASGSPEPWAMHGWTHRLTASRPNYQV